MLQLPLIIKSHKKIALSALAGVVILIGGVTTSVLLHTFNAPKPDAPDVKAERDYNELVKRREADLATIKKQIALPTNEEPIFATVSNAKTLPDNDFFKEALNNDRILMYPKHKKVYLYRPSTKQVLAVAPLDYQVGASATQSAVPAPSSAAVQISEVPTVVPVTAAAPAPHGKVLVQPQ